MVVYLATPIAVGRPRVEPGEELGEGDKEPDEWGDMVWTEVAEGSD
jgi:hypothetical protein